MILVDTSIWIDHLHASEPGLFALLHNDEVGCHPFVIEELALGTITNRETFLILLSSLKQFPQPSHTEVMLLVNTHRLWGRGLSAVDCHVLGAVALVPGAQLWTRDKRLTEACRDVGVACRDDLLA